MKQLLKHPKVGLLIGLFAIDTIFFSLTNPSTVPSIFLIVGYCLILLTLYWLLRGALAVAGLYSARVGRQRRLVAFLTAGAGLLVGLQSIGQLTLRDVIVVLLLAVILYAYLTYAKKRPVR